MAEKSTTTGGRVGVGALSPNCWIAHGSLGPGAEAGSRAAGRPSSCAPATTWSPGRRLTNSFSPSHTSPGRSLSPGRSASEQAGTVPPVKAGSSSRSLGRARLTATQPSPERTSWQRPPTETAPERAAPRVAARWVSRAPKSNARSVPNPRATTPRRRAVPSSRPMTSPVGHCGASPGHPVKDMAPDAAHRSTGQGAGPVALARSLTSGATAIPRRPSPATSRPTVSAAVDAPSEGAGRTGTQTTLARPCRCRARSPQAHLASRGSSQGTMSPNCSIVGVRAESSEGDPAPQARQPPGGWMVPRQRSFNRWPAEACRFHRGPTDEMQRRRDWFMELTVGARLRSAVSDAEVIVIRAQGGAVTVTCGGLPVLSGDDDSPKGEIQPGHEGSVVLGKRYVDESDTLELLCTKPGEGELAVDGLPLRLKSAKPLPSSD